MVDFAHWTRLLQARGYARGYYRHIADFALTRGDELSFRVLGLAAILNCSFYVFGGDASVMSVSVRDYWQLDRLHEIEVAFIEAVGEWKEKNGLDERGLK